ncbi:MAG: phosphoethanolamine transferase [Lentisphaeria bacterium]|nr:phosphoethanolamine transferase [Lentisphaeria bacterium]
MKKNKKKTAFSFKITDLFPEDVLCCSMLAGFLLFFPSLLILSATGFNNWIGVAAERLLLLLLFIVIGSVGPALCRRILMILMMVLLFLWDGVDLFCFLQLKNQIDPSFFVLLQTTNPNECIGFLKLTLFRPANLIILFYPACALLIWFFGKQYKKWLFPLSLLFPVLFVLLFHIEPSHNGKVLNFVDRIDETLDRIAETDLEERLLEIANTGLKVTASEKEMTIILVIGESHSKVHSGLYQYPRDTNPLLKKRVENGELFVFTDVVAPHSFTMYSVPKLLTLAAHDVRGAFLEMPNIFDLTKSAGFKTFWLCNHPALTDKNMVYAPVTARADVVIHSSSGNIQKTDDALFPAFQKALDDPAPLKLIVLQLIGSHHDYEQTYPSDKTFFALDSAPEFFNEEQKKNRRVVNAYDNSIRYNDYILDQFISRFAKNGKPGFLLYLPDHGENLYEQPGLFMHMEFMPTLQSVEIPMYLYLHPAHPDKSLVESVRHRPFASEDLPYLLLHLGKLNYAGADMKKSPFSPEFKPKKRLVSNCRVDYEKLKKDGHGNLRNKDLK